jgi:glycosyltransferase involved in cell wall biosynthesis
MNALRIGLFTYGMAQHLTGIGRYARELSYALQRLSLPLEIILLNPYPRSPLPWYRDFETYTLPRLQRLPGVLTFAPLDLARASRKLRLDILHDPCGIAPFLGHRSLSYARVVTIHDAIPLVHPEYQPLLTRLVYRTYLARARVTADRVLTMSQHSRQDIVRHLGIPEALVQVTTPGTPYPADSDLDRWRRQLPLILQHYRLSQPYFLSVGADNPRKNIAVSLEAFQVVHQRHSEARFVLVGPPPPHGRTSGAGVQHLGYVSEEHLHALYCGAAALIFPSLYEGFGFPALEALAHGTPVITSNVSSLPEIVGSAGFLVNPRETAPLAEAMRACLRPEIRARLFHEGRQRARRFSWERTALETWAVYQAVARRQHQLVNG